MFSKKLKLAMELNNITQAQLSRKSGLSKSSISQYLSGKFEPKSENLFILANALEVSVEFFYQDETNSDNLIKEDDNSIYQSSSNKLEEIIRGIFSNLDFLKEAEEIPFDNKLDYLKKLEDLIITKL